MTMDELCALCPNIPMREMLTKEGKGNSPMYSAPSFEWIPALNESWTEENLETLKTMTKAQVMAATRPYRDSKGHNEVVESLGYSATTDENTFAWGAVDSLDTFAQVAAKTYANDVLGENAKARLTEITNNLITDYKALVGSTPWLSEESKAKAIEKLDHITTNILEPAAGWFDYSGLNLTPTEEGGTLLSNYLKARQYRLDREAELIGQPAVGCTVWYMVNPTMANAFYEPTSNSINIIPGVMNSMIYSDDMDDSTLLGSLGWTIAYEISHGFDFIGAQFDAYGTNTPLFNEAYLDAFLAKTTAISEYFSTFELQPGVLYDGSKVVAEAAADLVGMQLVLDLMANLDNPSYEKFFAKSAKFYAETVPESVFPVLLADTHPLNYMRVNVNAQMYDPFYDVFGVTEGDGMYLAPEKRIVIWGEKA